MKKLILITVLGTVLCACTGKTEPVVSNVDSITICNDSIDTTAVDSITVDTIV